MGFYRVFFSLQMRYSTTLFYPISYFYKTLTLTNQIFILLHIRPMNSWSNFIQYPLHLYFSEIFKVYQILYRFYNNLLFPFVVPSLFLFYTLLLLFSKSNIFQSSFGSEEVSLLFWGAQYYHNFGRLQNRKLGNFFCL